jgi:hypothetical protein
VTPLVEISWDLKLIGKVKADISFSMEVRQLPSCRPTLS